jgi:hypothetical protein
MKRIFYFGGLTLVLVSLLFMAGCKLDDNKVQPSVPVSYVAFYNASPDAPGLNVSVDNAQINAQPFDYADYTGYLPFYTGQRHFTVGPADASNVVVDTTVNFVANKAYSVFVVDNYNHASLLVLNDSASTPVAGKAVIRLINLSPDAGTLHLSVKGNSEIGTGEAFKGASSFLSIDANTTTFEITGDGVSLEVPAETIHDGGYYSVVVKGYKTPPAGSKSVLNAQLL